MGRKAKDFLGLACLLALLFIVVAGPGGGGGSPPGGGCPAGQVGVGGLCTATPTFGVANTTAGSLSIAYGARPASNSIGFGAGVCADFDISTPDAGDNLCLDSSGNLTAKFGLTANSGTFSNSLTMGGSNSSQSILGQNNPHLRLTRNSTAQPSVGGTCGTSPVGPAATDVDQAFQFTTGTGSPTACTITLTATSNSLMHLICVNRTTPAVVIPASIVNSTITFGSLSASQAIECIGFFN